MSTRLESDLIRTRVGRRCRHWWAVPLAILATGGAESVFAQACPTPAIVVGTTCTVPAGTTITVLTGAVPGLSAANPGGVIDANGVTINLGPNGVPADRSYVGERVIGGGVINFNGSTMNTLQAGSSQRGLIATGIGSTVNASGSSIVVGFTSTSSDHVAILSEDGASIILTDTSVTMRGGAAGQRNHAIWARAGGAIAINGGSVSTQSTGSFGVHAQDGGIVTLSGGAQVSTTGGPITATNSGSHALYAIGTGSRIIGNGIVASTSGTRANTARAEGGGVINLISSQLTSSSAGLSDTDPGSALRAVTGGSVSISGAGSTINASGSRGHGVSAEGTGSSASVSDTIVTATGTRANALFVTGGASASVNNSTMSVSAANSIGTVVSLGSTLTMNNSSLSSSGATGFGMSVSTGSSANVTNSSISTVGINAVGVQVGSATLTANGLSVTTTGDGRPYGIISGLDGVVNITGGTIETFGDATDPSTANARRPEGLVSQNPNAFLSATGTTVLTHGLEAYGAVSDDGGTMVLDGVTIITEGLRGHGMYATTDRAPVNANTVTTSRTSVETFGQAAHGAMASQGNFAPLATVNLNANTRILTHGDASVGMKALQAGTVNANDSFATTEGTLAHGALALGNNSSVNLGIDPLAGGSLVIALGSTAHGAVAERGGLITGVDSAAIARGANSSALFVAGEPGFVSRATFTGTYGGVGLQNVSGPTIGVAGTGVVSLTNTVVGGSGQWLKVGTLTDFPALLAPELVQQHRSEEEIDPDGDGIDDPAPPLTAPPPLSLVPGQADITMSGTVVTGSALTMPGSVSNVTMLNDSLWNMTGSSNLTYLLNDPSLIAFAPPIGDPTQLASYMTLTVVNYVGDGGLLGLNTYLAADDAPSDRLVIDGGSAIGNSGLRVTNSGGGGAVTVANGILVVDAINGATTVPGAFALTSPVVAGPYEYSLYRGSVDATGPENWYLRSQYAPPPGPPGPPIPHFRQEVSLIASAPPLAALYGREMIDTFHERQGERIPLFGDLEEGEQDIAWARFIGIVGHHGGDPLGIYAGSEPIFDYKMGAAQFGMDLYRDDNHDNDEDTNDTAGLYIGFGNITGQVEHGLPDRQIFAGTENVGAFTVGGYWTHYGDVGQYLDAVLQASFYSIRHDSFRLPSSYTKGLGLAGSLEGGYPIQLDDGWQLEPQAQAVLQLISLDSFNDGFADISYSDATSLVGRLGLRLSHGLDFEPDDGKEDEGLAWARANIYHEFLGTPTTSFSSANGPVPFSANLQDTWLQLALGTDLDIRQDTSLFGQVSWDTTFDGASHAIEAKIGLKGKW
jgi:autotransporter family porin